MALCLFRAGEIRRVQLLYYKRKCSQLQDASTETSNLARSCVCLQLSATYGNRNTLEFQSLNTHVLSVS